MRNPLPNRNPTGAVLYWVWIISTSCPITCIYNVSQIFGGEEEEIALLVWNSVVPPWRSTKRTRVPTACPTALRQRIDLQWIYCVITLRKQLLGDAVYLLLRPAACFISPWPLMVILQRNLCSSNIGAIYQFCPKSKICLISRWINGTSVWEEEF